MSKIVMSEKSVINNAIGTHTNGNTIAVIDYTTGDTYTSMADVAVALNCSQQLVSAACCGRVKTCKGHVIEKIKSTSENVDSMSSRIKTLNAENAALKAKHAADAEDARKWREYQARLEAERVAEERRLETARRAEEVRQKQLAMLRAKYERNIARIQKMEEEINEAVAKRNDLVERNETILAGIAELERGEA